MKSLDTRGICYAFQSLTAYTLCQLWNIKLLKIRSDFGTTLYYRSELQ